MRCGMQPSGPSSRIGDSGTRHRSTSPDAIVARMWQNKNKSVEHSNHDNRIMEHATMIHMGVYVVQRYDKHTINHPLKHD